MIGTFGIILQISLYGHYIELARKLKSKLLKDSAGLWVFNILSTYDIAEFSKLGKIAIFAQNSSNLRFVGLHVDIISNMLKNFKLSVIAILPWSFVIASERHLKL